MRNKIQWSGIAVALITTAFLAGAAKQPNPVKRIGMVVGIKPEIIAKYRRFHADSNAGVRDLLAKYHMHNFSIFLQPIEGKWYEFGYYEYSGNDFDADMATA